MASADLREELNCSICLEVYTDPTTLRCGHNFCRACINRVLDKQKSQGGYTCPQCRATFRKRPWLQKNVTLANITERFQSMSLVQEKTRVLCTYCINAPVEAVKSCLHCEASLCDSHLKVHSKSSEHVLIEPTTSLENRKCPVHKKILEYYCGKDSTCICASCVQDVKHRGHPVSTLEVAFEDKKEKLKRVHTQLTSMSQETQKHFEKLQEKQKKAQNAADRKIQQVDALFRTIRDKLDNLHYQTVDGITKQVEKNSQPVYDLIQQLSVKKDEIASKMCHIEELSNATDPLTVLQERESSRSDFCVPGKGSHVKDPTIEELDDILISLTLREALSDIGALVPKALDVPEISKMQLDENTASTNVEISNDLYVALGIDVTDGDDTDEDTDEDADEYADDDRFESNQVLSGTGLSKGRHYWEVELCDSKSWRIGMAYSSIDRDGPTSIFGNTFESWCLCKSQRAYSFKHDGEQESVSTASFKKFKRLGIYLDYDEGRLSFYNLGLEVSHLHTYYESFTEPLHPAFRVAAGVWVKIIG